MNITTRTSLAAMILVPIIAQGRVFVYGAIGHLRCLADSAESCKLGVCQVLGLSEAMEESVFGTEGCRFESCWAS